MKPSLIRLKESLQFTGWLQYILTFVLATVILMLSLVALLFMGLWVVMPLLIISMALYIVLVIDIITVKFKIRPKEKMPKRNDELNLFDLMRKRSSCRSFQIKKLREEDFKELMAHVKEKMVTVNEGAEPKDEIRFEYISKPLTVWPVVNASEFIVAIGPKAYSHGAIVNIGRSLQKIVIHATRMGVATCWIGPGADQIAIVKQMGSKFNEVKDHIVCVCAIGYPSSYIPFSIRVMSKSQKRRLPLEKLFFEKAQKVEPLNIKKEDYKRFGRCFEICQWSPSSFNGQTTRAIICKNKADGVMIDFFCTTNSRYYGPLALGIWCGNWELGCKELGIRGQVFYNLSENENDQTKNGISWNEVI